MDKVSIILAFYNEELTITDCLNSLVNQTYKNIERILVDDSSTDKSTFIARDFERRYDFIKYFRIEHRALYFEMNVLGSQTLRCPTTPPTCLFFKCFAHNST